MKQRAIIFVFILLVATGATGRCARAANLFVNCDKKETIRETLKFLVAVNPQGPNTVTVVGSCRENISIQSMNRLTLITKKEASITDRSIGTVAVVDIKDSRSVTLQGFTINGGSAGVSCDASSVCYLTANTVQDAVGLGVNVAGGSHAILESNVIQNSTFRGSTVSQGSQMLSSNDIFQGNAAQGIVVIGGSYFEASNSSFLNNGVGVEGVINSTLLFRGGIISGSIGNGMTLLGSAAVTFQGNTTITGNGATGIHLEDGTFAGFLGATVTGNSSGIDVECAPQFPITRFVERTGGITNCVEGDSPTVRAKVK